MLRHLSILPLPVKEDLFQGQAADFSSSRKDSQFVCHEGIHENRVHYFRMKNITLSADEDLIERARLLARSQRKTLNAVFREWLMQYTSGSGEEQSFDALMKRLQQVSAGRVFNRDEMNER